MDAFEISASALTAQRLRMDVIASNLANTNTTRDAEGKLKAYRRRSVVFSSILQEQMGGGPGSVDGKNGQITLKGSATQESGGFTPTGVRVSEVVEDTKTPLKTIYDPSHPDANSEGYVQLPNISPINEMVDLIAATRAYEANVSSIQSAKSMGKSALEI